jgi:hypothetical protein
LSLARYFFFLEAVRLATFFFAGFDFFAAFFAAMFPPDVA